MLSKYNIANTRRNVKSSVRLLKKDGLRGAYYIEFKHIMIIYILWVQDISSKAIPSTGHLIYWAFRLKDIWSK